MEENPSSNCIHQTGHLLPSSILISSKYATFRIDWEGGNPLILCTLLKHVL